MTEDAILNDFASMKNCDKLYATSDFKHDNKDYLNEDSSRAKSDLDSEFEKCYKILGLESKMELKSCLNRDECNLEGFVREVDISNSRSDLIHESSSTVNNINNHRDIFSIQNEMSVRSFESPNSILLNDLFSKTNSEVLLQEIIDNLKTKTDKEREIFSKDETKYNLEENLNIRNNISPTKTCRVSLGSELDIRDAIYQNINTRSSFLNMTEEQRLHLKNNSINLNKESNSNKEKSDVIESIILSSDINGLLESESSSSLPEFRVDKTDKTSQNFNIKDLNKFSLIDHKILNNEADNLNKGLNFENLIEDVHQDSHKNLKLYKYDLKDYNVSQNKKIKLDTDFSDFNEFIQNGNLDAIFNKTERLNPYCNETSNKKISTNFEPIDNNEDMVKMKPIKEFGLLKESVTNILNDINSAHKMQLYNNNNDYQRLSEISTFSKTITSDSIRNDSLKFDVSIENQILSLNDRKNYLELPKENNTDILDSKEMEISSAICCKAQLIQMSDSQNLKPVINNVYKFCDSNLLKKACLNIKIDEINTVLDSKTGNKGAINHKIDTVQIFNSRITQNFKPSNKDYESAFCGKRVCTATCVERENNKLEGFLSNNKMAVVKLKPDESLNSNNNQNSKFFSSVAENTFGYENLQLTQPEIKQNSSLKIGDNKFIASSPISTMDLHLKQENLLKDSYEHKSLDIKNTHYKNDTLSTLISIKQEKFDENNEIKNMALGEKLCLKQEKCEESVEKENIALSKKLSISKNAITPKKDKKIHLPVQKVTPEKYEPTRIFKLAVANINNSKNSSNSSAPNIKKANSESKKVNLIKQEVLKTDNFENNKEMKDCQGVPYKKIVNPESDETNTDNLETLKKGEVKNGKIFKDYLEDEKEDLINPKWDAVKNLTTNEERYQQVRKCWGFRKIPNPNKNLTYHSYRKKIFGSGHLKPRTVTQHKRKASAIFKEKSAKRLCTFFLDREINNIKGTMENENQAIINKMNDKISFMEEQHYLRETKMQRIGNYGYDDTRLRNTRLHQQFNAKVSEITDEYYEIAKECKNKLKGKISALNKRRQEVLKFYKFYEGLNVSGEDPTQLTETQFQELDEIEDVYKQLDSYYRQH